jgi:hypothetical protein
MPYFGIPIRNGLPIGLGSVAGFGVQQFSPADLFSAGEQGAWYDPSDLSTLFTDSAGTTPVTAVEQFVGLMLDKSKGLVLGSELVTNGDFSSGTTGWTFYQSTLSAVSGKLRVTALSGAPGAYQSISIVSGKTYEVTFDIDVGTVGTGVYFVGNTGLGGTYTISASGKQTFRFLSTTTNAAFLFYIHRNSGAAAGQYFDLDNVSVKELAGNHATQTTSAKRPKLAARYNLLTYTEQFDNAAWTKSTATAAQTSVVSSPNGTVPVNIWQNSSTVYPSVFQSGVPVSASTPYTLRIYAQKANHDIVSLETRFASGDDADIDASYNLTTGVATAIAAGATASMTSVGGGWYLLSLTKTNPGSGTTCIPIIGGASSSGGSVLSVGLNFYIWGADLRPASQATGLIGPTYQRVVDAATYDAVGFLPYLEFDGIDDSMSTGSIDPGAVDKAQVFAGVRKLSDSFAIIAELSASVSSNNGVFGLWPPGFSGNFAFYSKGTSAAEPVRSLAAPVTAVLAGIGDISGDFAAIRVNGLQTTSSADQGTGNFGNYPLFIGARNNAGSFFQGWLSSMIVRFGANLSQSQIDSTESWVNQKTGAF